MQEAAAQREVARRGSRLRQVGGAVVYNEFSNVSAVGFILFGVGCVLAAGGVWLVTSKRTKGRREFLDLSSSEVSATRKSPSDSEPASMVPELDFGAGSSIAQFINNDMVMAET